MEVTHPIPSRGARRPASWRLARVLRADQEHRRFPAEPLGGWGRSGRRSGLRRPLSRPEAIRSSELTAQPNADCVPATLARQAAQFTRVNLGGRPGRAKLPVPSSKVGGVDLFKQTAFPLAAGPVIPDEHKGL